MPTACGLNIIGAVVPFHDRVKSFGVTLDSSLTMDRHVALEFCAAATTTCVHCVTSVLYWHTTLPRLSPIVLSNRDWTMPMHYTVRHDYHQPQQAAGGAEHTGQGGVSSTAFYQCHGVAKTTALVANPPANNIQDIGHYIQDQNYRHSCLLLSPDPGLPTRKDTTICWQLNCYSLYHGWHFRCQLKLSASALPQSGTHCHITVVPLNCSVLSSVT